MEKKIIVTERVVYVGECTNCGRTLESERELSGNIECRLCKSKRERRELNTKVMTELGGCTVVDIEMEGDNLTEIVLEDAEGGHYHISIEVWAEPLHLKMEYDSREHIQYRENMQKGIKS